MANPRKFSEKIALQKQKQAEGTAEFEKIMKEVYATKMDETQASQKVLEYCLVSAVDGSNAVNQSNKSICSSGNNSSATGGGGIVNSTNSGTNTVSGGGEASPDGSTSGGGGGGGGGGSPTTYRESRGRSVGVGPMRRPSERKQDRSPYGSSTNTNTIGISSSGNGTSGLTNNVQNVAYLSPPMDSSWRRSNSDSALHQSLNMAIAGESSFGVGGGIGGMATGMNSLHANYQHQHHHHNHGQRSQSPNIGRSFSPQAQRRKGNLIQQQQQQQFLQHHLQLQQQHQQQLQHTQQSQQQQMQQHMHMHQQQQQQQQQQTHSHQLPQQPPNYNAKFLNCNNMPAANSLFKSLQDQAMSFANTGSLPDLTSVHYAQQQQQPPPPQHQQQHHPQQQQQQQQQHTLSPVLSPHNNGRDRDQSPSPFSPTGGGGGNGGGPSSPYHPQLHSPTSAANTPTAAQASSPHLSFTNLSVQSPTPTQTQTGSFGNLTTLGAASSAGNLTDYRQPLNPPSPGSSPGLLTSASGNELHTSAPASPTRHMQTSLQQSLQGYNDKNIQAFDRYSPGIGAGNANSSVNNSASGNGAPGNIESSYNSLNPSFHNHFEQFSLGDSNSSPDQQHFQTNSFAGLEFDDFVSGSSGSYSQNPRIFNTLSAATTRDANNTSSNSVTTACNNNNNLQQQQQQSGRSTEQPRLLNNNSAANSNGPCHPNNNNSGGGVVSLPQHNDGTNASSPLPSPLGGCLPSPSSPLPIPMSAQHQQQQQHHHHHHLQNHHQLSLSLHSPHSPLHSPLHSPHHASSSPLSASSPSGITTMGCNNGLASTASTITANSVSTQSTHTSNAVNQSVASQQQQQSHQEHQQQQQHHQSQQQQQQQQSNAANTPTTNIPSIIFSDYSSTSDFPREIFDTLDLDLGQIDMTGLQMLSDQNAIMIADPTIEDSFRRDLN